MMRLTRIDDPQLSPNGKLVAFTAQTVDMSANTKPMQIYVVPVNGGAAVRVTNDGTQNSRPRWSADSRRIYFVSNRKNDVAGDESEIWSANPDGTDARMITSVPTGADGELLSADGQLMLFTSEVYPECQDPSAPPGVDYDAACNAAKHARDAAAKMNARSYDVLLYRHWTEYQGRRRRHLMIETLDNSFRVRDLTPGKKDTPPFSIGGPDNYAFSPDSVQVAYVTNTDPDLSISTNSDIFLVPASGGMPRRLTANLGADEAPQFSPDGKSIAYRTQFRSGFESDLWRLAVLDLATGSTTAIIDQLDRPVSEFSWAADSERIFFTVEDQGTAPLLMTGLSGGDVRTVAQGSTTIGSMQFSRDNRTMVYLEQSGSRPPEIKIATNRGGPSLQLTHFNDAIIAASQLAPLEKLDTDGAGGSKVQSFLVKPPDFDSRMRYPVLLLIHGGPQGDWGESWTYRWNAQVFAAAGYVVVMPNPHGSIGYGQTFTDAVSGDWGGRAYEDIMAVADHVATLPYVDRERMVAAGASYGGYMIDWILGHTNRFKALVSHAGVFNLVSEAGTTDELWFVKWEFKGFPWEDTTAYEKWSPNRFVNNFRTPTLVTQGEIDYRVPLGQSQELFTALQQKHIPSKLVLFPDEGHWLLKPQNSQYWYTTVIDWLDKYAKAVGLRPSS
jgi:dipeptidyl aminopeptidase/acylaminoacyl peptidase